MMNNHAVHYPRRIALAGIALIASLTLAQQAAAEVSCPQQDSAGLPVVHNQHIFCGEINNAGRATGFHSRPGGQNPAPVTNTPAPIPVGPAGIYTLSGFNITQHGVTRVKAISTMFPDTCSQSDVIAAIQNAVQNRQQGGNPNQFRGPSGNSCKAGQPAASFNIVGFLDDAGDVITAYPDYR